jgi:hypothetical protein
MSFPNPDNYARDCDCGTAGANMAPPPAIFQAEIDSLDTRVTVLEETNDVIVSSGGIANLTTAQQALIREGSIVVTTDGKRWVYSGAGSKVLEASYIQLSDVTIVSTDITDSTTDGRTLLTAASPQAQRTHLAIFVSAANLAAFPASGNFQRVYIAQDTGKTYVWDGSGYTEASPNTHTRAGAANINVGETALASASLTGPNNTAVGVNALAINTSGGSNAAYGTNALSSNIIGNGNSAFGVNALANSNADSNTAFGESSLKSNQTGINNVAVGISSLEACNSYNNTGVGKGSLFSCTSGNSNAAFGLNAGGTITTGIRNTLLGTQSDVDAQGRSNCVVIGSLAISPAVDGSLAIGGTGGNAMNGLTTTTAPTGVTGTWLRIWLNGLEYRIPIQRAS